MVGVPGQVSCQGWVLGSGFVVGFCGQVSWSDVKVRFQCRVLESALVVGFHDWVSWLGFGVRFLGWVLWSGFMVRYQGQVSVSGFGVRFQGQISIHTHPHAIAPRGQALGLGFMVGLEVNFIVGFCGQV